MSIKITGLDKFRKKLQSFADDSHEKAVELISELIINMRNDVILRTPVDTGVLRASWLIAWAKPDTAVWKGGNAQAGLRWSDNRSQRNLMKPPKSKLYLTNSIEYGEYVNYGTSRQPAQLFLEKGIQAAITRFNSILA